MMSWGIFMFDTMYTFRYHEHFMPEDSGIVTELKWHVCQTKAQISLGIYPVLSQSTLKLLKWTA